MSTKQIISCVLLTLALCSISSAQPDTTLKEFFPLQAGNVWQYLYTDPIGHQYLGTLKITRDTLMPNGQRYFVGADVVRIDSLYRVQEYRSYYGDSCGGVSNEINIYRLNEPIGSVWHLCENIVVTLCRPSLMRYDGVFTARIFGETHEIMKFTPGAICSGGDTTWYALDWLLVKGIGIYHEETLEISGRHLLGAIINGVKYGSVLSIPEIHSTVPTNLALFQNYPNPFNPSTTINYELPKSSEVRLSVFDILGREVSVLVNERREAGVHEVKFDSSNLASGVYFYRLQAGNFVQSKKLVIVK
jgi:hypothetical protein